MLVGETRKPLEDIILIIRNKVFGIIFFTKDQRIIWEDCGWK